MSNFSRRFFLILLGALATSGVAQSSDAASTKKPTPTPTPKKTTAKKPTPTPTPKKTTAAPKKPTPSPTTKKPTPTATPTQSKVVESPNCDSLHHLKQVKVRQTHSNPRTKQA